MSGFLAALKTWRVARWLAGNWKLLAIGLPALGLVGYILLLRHQIGEAREDAEGWQRRATMAAAQLHATREAFDYYKAQAAEQAAAMARLKVEAENRAARLARILTEAEHETEDDRVVGPVLQRHADRLRLDAARPGGGDPGGAGGADPGAP